jgi:protein-S-isoprenylcysteine O-methyltransferase Ste14
LLILIFWQWRPIPGIVWDVQNAAGRFVLHALFAMGWGLVLLSTFLINHFDLFGLRQVYLHLQGRPYEPLPFKTPGLYRYVRHPLYLGWFFAFWATPTMSAGHLEFSIATTAYILIAIIFEERDLVTFHGELYVRYRERVSMIIPLPRGRS